MYKEITPAGGEPITREEAKEHLKVDPDITADDALIDRLLKGARQFVEKRTGIACLSSTWELILDQFPASGVIYILKKPVTAISKVEYYASDDAAEYTELSASNYQTDVDSNVARVRITSVPSIGDKLNAVKVTFVVGYSASENVPEYIRSAILVLTGHLYENRQEEITGTVISRLGKGFEYLLSTDEILSP